MEEKILKILQEINNEITSNNMNNNLLNEGLIDSFDIVNLISELEEEFNVEFEATDIVEENFMSITAIMELIKRKLV